MRINKTKKASITIYLSLIFVTVLLLISIIIESARMNMVQSECKTFTYLATDSVLAGYARQVYEDSLYTFSLYSFLSLYFLISSFS